MQLKRPKKRLVLKYITWALERLLMISLRMMESITGRYGWGGIHLSGEPRVNAADEMSELRWFSWGEGPGDLFLPFRNLIEGDGYS